LYIKELAVIAIKSVSRYFS